MFKNIKKVLFALVLALVTVFAFACGDDVVEANKENCKDFCEECPTCAPEANDENCKDFCETCPEIDDEACKDFQDFVAPESFYMDVPNVKVGETTEVYLDEFDPEDAYQGLVFTSSNPEIATVDAKGVVTGVRPGKCTVTATSVLDPEVSESYEFEVEDALSDLEVLARELAYLQAQLPNFVTETYEFPKPWNTSVEVVWMVNGVAAADGKLVVADLTGDVKNTIAVQVTYNGESDQATGAVVWSVKDANVNSFTRIEKAVAAADALMAEYALAGVQVTGDLSLPATIFGCTMNWATSNKAVINTEGKYTRPLDDKAITLSINATYGDNIGKGSYNVVAKGYTAEEKADYIMANVFANLAGKEVNTDLVLPEFDNLFGAKLTYKSGDAAVYGDDGKLVAAPAEAKEVKFTVTIDYAIAGNAKDNFKVEKELVVKAVPATKASEAVQAWLATDAGKAFGKVAHAPYGTEAGNVLALPTEGYAWNVDAVKLAVKNQAEDEDLYQIFTLTEDKKVKLNAQYLRYTLVNLTGVYTADDGSKANINLFLNVGVSETPHVIYTGTWRSSDQGDGSLSEIQGKYDITSNVSYFDKKVGNIATTYGSGWWSGYVMTATDENGQVWKSYVMEMMTAYIELDEEGNAVFNVANINGGTGGNWGVFFVNNTGEDVNIEVGTYGTTAYQLADGSAIASVGSRNNLAMDGYAPGMIVGPDGVVLHKSTDDKLEYGMENNKGYIGGKQYKAGDVIDATLYAAMADQFKFKADESALWEAKYAASADMVFEAKADGTYKKVTAEDGTVSYAKIEEGEEVTEKFAPKYAKGAALTAGEYEALAEADKALVTVTYAAKEAVDFTVENLLGDSSKGTLVHYLTIPAGGYAMSWKYQFYGVGAATTLRTFTQGNIVKVEKYDVHYLNCKDGEYAADYLASAQEILAAQDVAKNASAETYVIGARNYYDKLQGATKADVFAEADLVAAEAALAALVDKEITDFLASEEEADKSEFATTLGKMYTRFEKYTDELAAGLTKKEEFDAKYAEYAKIDLTITYDYKGGYAQGYVYDTQKDAIMPLFLKDLYDHMVEKGAFQKKVENDALVDDPSGVAPSFETFCSNDYWAGFAQYKMTLLSFYLFTPYAEGETINENYHDLIEGSDRFFNTEKGQYWIALADWVNEATQYANGAGQDFWGRNGLPYVTYDLLAKQSYYVAGSMYKDPSGVNSTNSGTLLGAYRFAQYVNNSSINANYKTYIPNKVWATVFDRQTTQEEYGRQIYHCTDATVKLLDEPYKEGYKFLGWVFEDGSEAVVTGSMFKDITVYAKWAANVEELAEAEVGKDLTPVYYGEKGTGVGPYMSATPTGASVEVQAANVGVGNVAVVVGDKLFPLPAKALIELGKDATAAATLDKAALQPYGSDSDTNNSTGLRYDAVTGTVVNGDSYGHGAMYYNAGQFDLTLELSDCYGRILGGAAYGYHKYAFTYDAENSKYVAKLVGGAAGSYTLKPGEYLWCPMTAERFCTGLTDCDGTSGVAGVLSDGAEVQVITLKLAQDVNYIGVEFFNGAELVSGKYVEAEKATIEKPADLGQLGYAFKGWAKDPNATEGEEIPAETTESVKYYAVWEVLVEFDDTVVDPANVGANVYTFATIFEALNATKEGGTITVKAGTYDQPLDIKRAVTIIGPNAGKAGTDTNRAEEAVINAPITINAEGVVVDGVKLGTASNILFNAGKAKVTNVYSLASTFLKTDAINRTAVLYASVDVSDIEVSNCYFNTGSATYLKGVWASAGVVSNIAFLDNYFTHEGTDNSSLSDCIAMYHTAGKLDFIGNHFVWVTDDWDLMIGYNSNQCTEINVIKNTFDGVGDLYTCGITIRRITDGNVCNIIGNTFNTLAGTIISGTNSLSGAIFNIKYNAFMNCSYKESTWATGVVANFENNYYAKAQTSATPDVDQLASKDAFDELYKDYFAEIQDFADEMVALFNATDISGKVTTTQNNFCGTTHPNVKGVFANADTLAKYKWFLEFALAEITEASTASELLEDAYYTETKEMLEKMIAGDTTAISGSYANGRTCFRQYIHKLINAENPNAGTGNTAYNKCVVDYAANPEKLAAFMELYKANN